MQYESFEDVLALVDFGVNNSFGISNSNPARLKNVLLNHPYITTYHEESGESRHEEDDAEGRARSPAAVALLAASLTLLLSVALGPNSIDIFGLEFRLKKPLEFCLEIPYTKKMFKNG